MIESESRSDGSVVRPVILFANEFFDALPVDIVDHRGSVRVAEEQGRFVEQFVSPSSEELDYIDRYSIHPEPGERVEVSLAALDWMDRIAQLFRNRRGFAMFIDYGYTREEQLAGRHRDTLMTYRQHRASASPYEAPGEQDITAHVNFTALRARAAEARLDDIALLTQTQLLLGIGEETQFADAFQDCKLPQERAKVALQLRHLLSPEEMGEKFQVLLLSRGVPRRQSTPAERDQAAGTLSTPALVTPIQSDNPRASQLALNWLGAPRHLRRVLLSHDCLPRVHSSTDVAIPAGNHQKEISNEKSETTWMDWHAARPCCCGALWLSRRQAPTRRHSQELRARRQTRRSRSAGYGRIPRPAWISGTGRERAIRWAPPALPAARCRTTPS